jgi:uncharacterized protein (DUF58 family)
MNETQVISGKRKGLAQLLEPSFMARLDSLDILSHRILRGRLHGQRRSKQRGQSVEFADHRGYVEGDDLRFVDWNIYGRLEQLFVKLFLEEQDLTVHILMDSTGSTALPDANKGLYIQRVTAALAYVALVGNNRVTLSSFNNGLTGQIANMRGRVYLPRMAEFLLSRQAEGTGDFDRACKQAAASRMGSGVMIVVSDFLFKEGYESGLRRLISPSYELYAIQTLSRQETQPSLTGDLKLVDVEDGDTAEITVSAALLKYYKQTLAAFCNELKEFCVRRGGSYVLAETTTPVETLVLNTLRRIRLIR